MDCLRKKKKKHSPLSSNVEERWNGVEGLKRKVGKGVKWVRKWVFGACGGRNLNKKTESLKKTQIKTKKMPTFLRWPTFVSLRTKSNIIAHVWKAVVGFGACGGRLSDVVRWSILSKREEVKLHLAKFRKRRYKKISTQIFYPYYLSKVSTTKYYKIFWEPSHYSLYI